MYTKFEIGQELYTIEREEKPTEIKCSYCNGKGKIKTIDEESQEKICYNCFGKGKETASSWQQNWITKEESRVYGIAINNFSTIFYELEDSEEREEEDCFLTEEEAQEECKKRNSVLKQ